MIPCQRLLFELRTIYFNSLEFDWAGIDMFQGRRSVARWSGKKLSDTFIFCEGWRGVSKSAIGTPSRPKGYPVIRPSSPLEKNWAVMQITSLITMLVPNIYTLAVECAWFSVLVRACAFCTWTCWNTLFMLFLLGARSYKFWKRKGKSFIALKPGPPPLFRKPLVVLNLSGPAPLLRKPSVLSNAY